MSEVGTTVEFIFNGLNPGKLKQRLPELPRCVEDYVRSLRAQLTTGLATSKKVSPLRGSAVAKEILLYYVDRPTLHKGKFTNEATLILERLEAILKLINPLWGEMVWDELQKDEEMQDIIKVSARKLALKSDSVH
jgi:hypothetical protein